MSNVSGKEIAELIISLNMNLVRWNRNHFEQLFSTNGKGDEGTLTMQQFHILITIRDCGITTISKISELFCLSKSSMSLTMSKMVAKGYLTKEIPLDGDDGRKIYFSLTPKALSALATTEKAIMEIAGKQFDSLTEEKKLALYDHLTKINHLLTGGSEQ